MNIKLIATLFSFLFLLACSKDLTLTQDEKDFLKSDITTMYEEYEDGFSDSLLEKTHPSLIKLMGGESTFKKTLDGANQMMVEQDMKFLDSEIFEPFGGYEVEHEILYFVPRITTMSVGDQKIKLTGFMVAVKNTKTDSWTYLDGSGLESNPKLLWRLFPKLTKDIIFPENSSEIL